MDLSFVNFIATLNRKQEEDVFSLTVEQENFFAQNLDYFLFFHKIFRDFFSAKQCKEKWNISDKKYWKILRKLEEFKLIEIMPGEEIKFLVSGGLNYIPNGDLQLVILNQLSKNFNEFLLSDNQNIDHLRDKNTTPVLQAYMRMYFGKVHPTSYQRFLDGLRAIHQDFARSCIKDRKSLSRENLVDVTWSLGLANINGMNFLFKNSSISEKN